MNFDPDSIKKLITDAYSLLEQDEVDVSSKTAIENCLKSIQNYDRLGVQNKIEIV